MSQVFEQLKEQVGRLREAFVGRLAEAVDAQTLEQVRVHFLGKKSELIAMMKQMGSLESEERKHFGQLANELRNSIEQALEEKLNVAKRAEEARRLQKEAIDITLPSVGTSRGGRHPVQQTIDQVRDIFVGLGYQIAEGPEIEFVRYNFDLLRIPEGHPSREHQDTFYLSDDVLLRTQTSGVQVRVMENCKPPIRIIAPGKVYRPDTPDATHSPIFHQIEGLVIDKGVSMGDLVGTLRLFAKELFGEQTEIRLRPHHFPFTEPSCEVDVSCWRCAGKGCPTCKQEGFVEVLGAGMVHPWILEQCGIDPKVYSGFAFGIGAERVAMAKFDVDDIRHFYENNVDFLKQFR